MFRISATPRLAIFAIGAAALGLATLSFTGTSEAYDGRHDQGFERPAHGWRPQPPVFHGYWGHRYWQRYRDGFDFRAPPPPPGPYYRYGWR